MSCELLMLLTFLQVWLCSVMVLEKFFEDHETAYYHPLNIIQNIQNETCIFLRFYTSKSAWGQIDRTLMCQNVYETLKTYGVHFVFTQYLMPFEE